MKILLPFLLVGSFALHAQTDSSVAYSRLEEAVMKPGNFVELSQQNEGHVDDVAVGIITGLVVDSGTHTRNVICFSPKNIFYNEEFELSDIHVDEEELDRLIEVIGAMKKIAENRSLRSIKSYSYTTSNLIVFSLGNRRTNYRRWDLVISKRYKNINKPVPGAHISVNGIYLADLLKILSQIKETLVVE